MTRSLLSAPLRTAAGLVAPALLVALWQWNSGGALGSVAIAPPSALLTAGRELVADGTLGAGVAATLARALTGFGIGAALGFLTGVAMALSSAVNRVLGPLLQALRQVPMLGWMPLIALWFGTGEGSELIVVCVASFFPTLLSTHSGLRQVESRYLEVGRIYGLDTGQRFALVQLPAALPFVLTGLNQALAFAWIATIASEILLGTGAGLGVTMQQAQMQQRLDMMLVAVIVTAFLGFAINQILLHLRRGLLRWQPDNR
ncbi:ABC transporter permease [Novosphingobium flavum]|nr:ABC transporter permease [Novosphingobium flavum]